MKQAILANEQKFFINGTGISGVQSVEGSYVITEKPISILGWGGVGEDYYPDLGRFELEANQRLSCDGFVLDEDSFYVIQEDLYACGRKNNVRIPCQKPQSLAVLNAPLEGSFNINSLLISQDFFLRFLGDIPFTGSIHASASQYFGFHSGYITNHTVSCNVGELPRTSTQIRVFGDIGGSPSFLDQEENKFSVQHEDGFVVMLEESLNDGIYNAFDPNDENLFPEIQIPDQGSIIIECTGASTDRVTSFNHSINIPIDPIYTIGSPYAAQVDVIWPATTETSFTLDLDEHQYHHLRGYMVKPEAQDIAVKINNCFGEPIQHYTIKKARLIGETMSSSIDGRMTVNLSYKSYYNKRGKRPHEEDLNYENFKEQAWTPSNEDTIDIMMWYDASDTKYLDNSGYDINTWYDRSGNSRHITPRRSQDVPRYTQYIFNKKPSLNFISNTSLGYSQDNKINTSEGFYIFIVGKFSDSKKEGFIFDTIDNDFGLQFTRIALKRNVSLGNQYNSVPANTLELFSEVRDSDGHYVKNGSIKTPELIGNKVASDISNFILTCYVSKKESYIDVNGRSYLIEGDLGVFDFKNLIIGGGDYPRDNSMNGFISEVMIMEGPLGDTNIFKTQGYLAHKWDIERVLRYNHRYRYERPKV